MQKLPLAGIPSVSDLELSKAFDDVTYTSCPLQVIPTKLLKSMKSILLPIILYLFNFHLNSGTYPKCLKTGTVITLLKKTNADPEVFQNYRPVTNIHFFAKVLETLVAKLFTTLLESNNAFDPFQSAYRFFHSIETALLRITNDVFCSLDKKKLVVLIALDLSAAFDTVDHSKLCDILENRLGVKKKALS